MEYYRVKHEKVSVTSFKNICVRHLKITRKLPLYSKYDFKVVIN